MGSHRKNKLKSKQKKKKQQSNAMHHGSEWREREKDSTVEPLPPTRVLSADGLRVWVLCSVWVWVLWVLCSVWVWVLCSVLLGVGVGSLLGVGVGFLFFPFLCSFLFFPFLCSFLFFCSFLFW